MRELINIQIGQCGNSISQSFLENLNEEHCINDDCEYFGKEDVRRQRINVFYNQHPNNKFTSRTILADLEPGSIDAARASHLGKLYNPDNFVVGLGSAGNNWGVGHYEKGAQLVDVLMDAIRRQSEACDHLQGFQMMHSTGGGTGSGWGTLAIAKIREEFGDRLIQTYSVYPSSKDSDIVVDAYNATLSTHQLVENAQMVHIFQNRPLFDICKNKIRTETLNFEVINDLIARTASGVTCGMRFPGQINPTLRKQATNLIPFPRLHFFMDSLSPLVPIAKRLRKFNAAEIMTQLYDKNSFMTEADPTQGRFMTGSAIFRGKISSSEAEKVCLQVQNKNSSYFFEWIPNNIQCSICDISLPGEESGGVLVGNSTSIQNIFKTIAQKFTALFRRKAFLHWYTGIGMDEMEFTEAESNMNDLVSEYQPCCGCLSAEEQGQFDEEEEEGEYQVGFSQIRRSLPKVKY